MKRLILFILLFGLIACNENNSKELDSISKNDAEQEVSKTQSTALPETSIYNLPSKWTTQDKVKLQLKKFRGKTVVIAMIYSSCTTACPILIASMRNIENQISKKYLDEIKFVLVSIDPKTDTPEHLKKFSIKNNLTDDQWVFLRGSIENTRTLANTLAVKYRKISPMDFSHSNIITVLDKNGVIIHQKEGLNTDYDKTVKTIMKEVKS